MNSYDMQLYVAIQLCTVLCCVNFFCLFIRMQLATQLYVAIATDRPCAGYRPRAVRIALQFFIQSLYSYLIIQSVKDQENNNNEIRSDRACIQLQNCIKCSCAISVLLTKQCYNNNARNYNNTLCDCVHMQYMSY